MCCTHPAPPPSPLSRSRHLIANKTKSAEEIAEEVAKKARQVAIDEKAAADAAAEKEKQDRIARKKALNERFNAAKST